MESLSQKQRGKFTVQKTEEVGFELTSGLPKLLGQRLYSFKLIETKNTANVILLRHNSISISRLPPYENWDNLFANFKKYYDIYIKKNTGSINRIASRYINRIDIPKNGKKIKIEDYIKIVPKIPNKDLPALSNYLVQATFQIDENHVITLNSYRYPETVLIDHISIILDLDVAKIKDFPYNEKSLLDAFIGIRENKNKFFERLITQKCRGLFNHEII